MFSFSLLRKPNLELCYRCTIDCREDDKTHIRLLLLQSFSNNKIELRSLRSEDLEKPNMVAVEANIMTQERQDDG